MIDFDGTIINGDIIDTLFKNTLNKEDLLKINETEKTNYAKKLIEYYKILKSYNKTLQNINSIFESVEFNQGIKDLFSYIRQNKNKYYLILITGDDLYSTTYFLKQKNIYDLFVYYFGIPSQESSEKEKGIINIELLPKHSCDFCDDSLCKSNEFQKFLENNPCYKNNNIIYICDGWNDYCIASKFLKKSDFLFVREGYSLSKLLKKEKYNKNIICEVKYWKDGFEIINELKKI